MTIANIQNSLKALVNPNTGRTLHEEGRIVEIKTEQNELLFKYKRDGITPERKRAIETLHVSKHRLGHSLVSNLISHNERL